MTETRFYKNVVIVNGLVPLALLGWDAYHHQLGVNAVNFAIRTTGLLALIFLLLSLLITPLRRLTAWDSLINYRRSLGLFGFFYACVHLGIFFFWDRAASVSGTINEIFARTYLIIGAIAIVLMIPLAITSTNGMVRRLGGKKWKLLHRLAYVAASAGAFHYYLQGKADKRQSLWFAGVLAILLLARLIWHYFDLRKAARRSAVPMATATVSAKRKFWTGELKVARVFDETPHVRTFRLTTIDGMALPFDYRPGQYLNLQLMIDGKRVKRSYTIASTPTRSSYCELTVKREEMGVSSNHLHREIREGDRLKISAPAGRFIFTGDEAQSVVLVAGGVGVTPMMSIARYLTDRCWQGDIYFVFVARTTHDIIFKDELEQLQRRFPNLRLCITLTNADENWPGDRGRLDAEKLNRFVPELSRRLFYLCGPEQMMTATQNLLREMGLPDEKLKTEAFVSPGSQVAGAVDASNTNDIDVAPAEVDEDASVNFVKSGLNASLTPEKTVLEAAEEVGVDIPFECRAGICGQCKTKLLSGKVMMDSEDALSAAEKSMGFILACQAHAIQSIVVEA